MALAITEDHRALADVVRSFTVANPLRSAARAALDGADTVAAEVWGKIAAQGWLGLHVPEEYGGSGYTLSEAAVVAEEFGYALAPGGLLPSLVLSATLTEIGTDAQRKTYLQGIAEGESLAGLALGAGVTRGSNGLVSGTVSGLLSGGAASLLLIRVGEDLVLIASDHPGVIVGAKASIDALLGVAPLRLDNVSIDADAVLVGGAATAVRLLRTLSAAEAAGGARAVLDTALAYAKVREQFGRTIGSFQAVKHHLANMLVQVELSTAVSWDAARATPGTQAELAAAAAATIAPVAFQENAQKSIQLLGGIGFTWEHDAHLYLRRAAALRTVLASLGAAEDAVFHLTQNGVRREYGVDLPADAEAYREQALSFLAEYRAADPEGRRTLLAETGYLVPHWPQPFGRGAGPVEQLVIEQELAEVEPPVLGIGGWVLLTLTQTANEEQIARWIPQSLRGDYQWCQLFSEPNAGSDAAAVQTRGVKVDGGWRISGQKVWTSGAQDCNRGLATIRTDPSAPKHKGITAMVIDMQAPGVEVRPLREITGEALFNEVFFDDVFIPDGDVVGQVNDGWRVARTTLGNERVTIGGGSREGIPADKLVELVATYAAGDVELQRAAGRLVVEEQAMRLINLRQVTRAVAGSGPGPEGNVTKLLSAEHAQRVTELALQISGVAAIDGREDEVLFEYLFDRCLSIAGGTSEISRNVIAERILGLPREPGIR